MREMGGLVPAVREIWALKGEQGCVGEGGERGGERGRESSERLPTWRAGPGVVCLWGQELVSVGVFSPQVGNLVFPEEKLVVSCVALHLGKLIAFRKEGIVKEGGMREKKKETKGFYFS